MTEDKTAWKKAVYAFQFEKNGDICPECDQWECKCPGPTMEGWEYMTDEYGIEWARKRKTT